MKVKLSDDKLRFEDARKRLNQAKNYLIEERIVERQKDIAERLGIRESPFSQALKGNPVNLTQSFLVRFAIAFKDVFNKDWIVYGHGGMLSDNIGQVVESSTTPSVQNGVVENSPNAIVNAAYNGDVLVSDGVHVKNKYEDSILGERKWAPVVPPSMAKKKDFDIFVHIAKKMGGNFERLYSGTANIDIWHYVTDNDLYPFYQKGDCLGLKAYEQNDYRIKTGNVYVVDTKRDGFIFRRFRLADNGEFESYNFNESDPQVFTIPKSDVIRVYSVVLMFRY